MPLPLLPMVSMTSTMVMGRSKTDLSWGRGSSFLLSRIVSSYLAVSRITTETRTVAACLHGRVLVDAMYSASPPLNVGPARVNRPVRTIVTRADCRRKRPVIREIYDRLS